MHFDTYGAFLIVVFNVVFWLLVLYRRSRNDLANSYFWWSFFITLWAFGYGITLGGFFDYEPTLIWNKYCQAMALMVAPFFFHFGCMVAKQYEAHKRIFWFYFIVAAANAVALFFTNYYVRGLWSFAGYKYQPLGGPLYWLFTLIFFWCTLHAFWIVAKNYKNSKGLHRKQMASFLLATGLSYLGGLSLFLQAYHIQFPSTGVYLILSYNFIIGYSVIRYQFLDIDELVEIVRREKLAALGMLAASVNHEIRNPLYIVKAYAERLLANVKNGSFEKLPSQEREKKVEEVLEKVTRQMGRAVEMTEKITGFSKPSTDTLEKMPLHEAIESILSFIGYGLERDNIQIEKKLDLNSPIHANRKEMEQIFLNLIMNASQAMPKGGLLTIANRQHNQSIQINISDTGEGIPPDHLKRVFEPFFTTKKDEGTGLGLYIVKKLVERNGGKIKVTSEVGRGTTFSLDFPIMSEK